MNKVLTISGVILVSSLFGCAEKEVEPKVDPKLVEGEQIVKANCKVCHAQGINGAPVIGNTKMWAKRKQQPLETLVEHASNGFGLMPAKGGNTELTEEQITLAIQYMLSQVQE